MPSARKKRLAVWKFASCDGCQLTLLNCDEALLALADTLNIAYFPEALSAPPRGQFDLSLVEGSITTPKDDARILDIRRRSKALVTIGACATAGGIQALRDFSDVKQYAAIVYARPDYIETLAESTPIAQRVKVDFELRGCPISRFQLLETISAFLAGRRPATPPHSVCIECKARGNVCVAVAQGTPCMGPVTQAGCGAICPTYGRGCYGCFGPMETPNTPAMSDNLKALGMTRSDITRFYRSFNAGSPAFKHESARHEP